MVRLKVQVKWPGGGPAVDHKIPEQGQANPEQADDQHPEDGAARGEGQVDSYPA